MYVDIVVLIVALAINMMWHVDACQQAVCAGVPRLSRISPRPAHVTPACCIHHVGAKRLPCLPISNGTGACVCCTTSIIVSASARPRLITVIVAIRALLSTRFVGLSTTWWYGSECKSGSKLGTRGAVTKRLS